jgi:hypothetical protein
MVSGFVSLDQVVAASLVWSEKAPEIRFWFDNKYDESSRPVIRSNVFTRKGGVRSAHRCKACETLVVARRDTK